MPFVLEAFVVKNPEYFLGDGRISFFGALIVVVEVTVAGEAVSDLWATDLINQTTSTIRNSAKEIFKKKIKRSLIFSIVIVGM